MGLFDLFNKKPIIKEKTFLVWEPCGKSHAEVVPGFVKYLLDLGYHVSVLVSPNAYKEKLFARRRACCPAELWLNLRRLHHEPN